MRTSWLQRLARGPRLPIAVGVVALALGSLSTFLLPPGLLHRLPVLAAATLFATLAGLHRPLGGAGLGLGTFVLPAVTVLAGPLPAALSAGVALLTIELVHRYLSLQGPNPPLERRRPLRAVETAASGTVSTLAACAAWAALAPAEVYDLTDSRLLDAAGAAAAAQLLFELAWRWLAQRRYRPRDRPDFAAYLLSLAVDVTGWWVGLPLAIVTARLGLGVAAPLAASLALAAMEGFRNARLLALSRQRASEIEDVGRAGRRVLTGTVEIEALAESILRECQKVVNFRHFQFELLAAASGVKSWMAEPGGPLREGVPQPERNAPALPGFHRRRGWKVLDYPLEARGRVLANLRLWCDPRELDRSEIELLEALREQLAASVDRALLDREAKLDPLTGVAVRRVLEQQIDPVYQRCLEDGSAMALVLCDLDHFKRINDNFGHGTGDLALKAVAALLAHRIKQTDLCCRYGGEEFVLLLPGADGPTGLVVAERLRHDVEEMEFFSEDGQQRIKLTLSAGIAAFPDLYVSGPRELVALADAALYEAKRRGRNLCLLDLGRGRYRDAGGRLHANLHPDEPPAPPRLFA